MYYTPKPVSAADLELMKAIDRLHLEAPFAGSRMMQKLLGAEGFGVGRRHVRRLMRKMDIKALYRKKHTSRRHPGHEVFPYLLRHRTITAQNEAWALDITYLPMARGFVYFVGVMDWATRRILSCRLSTTLTADFCIEALEEAIARYGCPEIVNTDQGSQFTSAAFVELVHRHGIALSMDGQVLVEGQRLHRALLADAEIRGSLSASL